MPSEEESDASTLLGGGPQTLAPPPLPLAPSTLLWFFTAANTLIFIDRGVLSGASLQLDAFIGESLGVSPQHENVYLGMLSSAFIAGYAVAAVWFGHAVHRNPPLLLIAAGLSAWCVAACLSALAGAPGVRSFALLLLGRVVSGVGEASLLVIAPALIEERAPVGQQARWLGIYYTTIPAGTALGYGFGAAMAGSAAGWPGAFLVEATAMAPFVLWCRVHHALELGGLGGRRKEGKTAGEEERQEDDCGDNGGASGGGDGGQEVPRKPTAMVEFWIVCRSKVFLLVVAGYSAYTASLAGFSAFAPQILLELVGANGQRFFTSQVRASLTVGAFIAAAGLLGTPLGGLLLDRSMVAAAAAAMPKGGSEEVGKEGRQKEVAAKLESGAGEEGGAVNYGAATPVLFGGNDSSGEGEGAAFEIDHSGACPSTAHQRCQCATEQLALTSTVGFFCLLLTVVFEAEAGVWVYMCGLGLGCLALFMGSAAATVAVFASVPPAQRSFAIGLNTLAIHVLGDVPSPIAIGALKDSLAPQCAVKSSDAEVPPACFEAPAQRGLLLTQLVIIGWLTWTVLLWVLAWRVAARPHHKTDPGLGAVDATEETARRVKGIVSS